MSSYTPILNGNLFHYTCTSEAKIIKSYGVISQKNNKILLTTLRPEEHYRDEILQNNYGSNIPHNLKNMADNVVLVDFNKLDQSKLIDHSSNGRILYEYQGDISVSCNNVIDKPKCAKPSNNVAHSSQSSGIGQSISHQQANPKYFYHYTSTKCSQRISKEKILRMVNGKVILTTLAPENYYRNEILAIIYGSNYDPQKLATFADYCVKVNSSLVDPKKLINIKADLYEYQSDINVTSGDVIDKPKCIKMNANNSQFPNDNFLYHYTNKKGADAIKAAKFLKKSGSSGAFGVGVYMTDLRPTDFFRDDILNNNYGGISQAFLGRADWVVRIDKSKLNQAQLRKVSSNVTRDGNRSIYVYPDIITVNPNDVFDKPKCYRAK